MAELASLWIGARLGELERISAASFIAHGDHLTLYSYTPMEDVPPGVERRDAREVWEESRILRFRNGSPAPHADLFRYRLMKKTDKTWVDLDIVAFKPFAFETRSVFGLQDGDLANTAVLRLPPGSPTLNRLLELDLDTVGYPAHFGKIRKLKWQFRTGFRGIPISNWRWGWTGPYLFNYWLHYYGEIAQALPQSTFYHVRDARAFVTPGALSVTDFPGDAYGAHFWGSEARGILRQEYGDAIPKESFLDWASKSFLE